MVRWCDYEDLEMGVILFGYIDFEGQDIVPLLQGAREMIEVVYDEPGCIHYVWTADVLREGRLWVMRDGIERGARGVILPPNPISRWPAI